MNPLTKLPNIGPVLADQLNTIGVCTEQDLKEMGSENAVIKIVTFEHSGVCINMVYALEGAIQGIRWHGLSRERKEELKVFFRRVQEMK